MLGFEWEPFLYVLVNVYVAEAKVARGERMGSKRLSHPLWAIGSPHESQLEKHCVGVVTVKCPYRGNREESFARLRSR